MDEAAGGHCNLCYDHLKGILNHCLHQYSIKGTLFDSPQITRNIYPVPEMQSTYALPSQPSTVVHLTFHLMASL